MLHQNNIYGKALSFLLENKGYQVQYIPIHHRQEKLNIPPFFKHPALLIINTDLIQTLNILQLQKYLNESHGIVLIGQICDLHWFGKIEIEGKGFISKNSAAKELFSILDEVRRQNTALGKATQNYLYKASLEKQNALLSKKLKKPLTKTELKILNQISLGKSSKQIADKYYRSIHTIHNHRKNIKRKFYNSSSSQLEKFCILHKDAIKTLLFISNNKMFSSLRKK